MRQNALSPVAVDRGDTSRSKVNGRAKGDTTSTQIETSSDSMVVTLRTKLTIAKVICGTEREKVRIKHS